LKKSYSEFKIDAREKFHFDGDYEAQQLLISSNSDELSITMEDSDKACNCM